MPSTVDRFIQGVSLGQNARQIDNQEEQFKTNLSERARETNRQFDLDQDQLDSQISRNNAYVSKVQYDLKQQTLEDNMEAVQNKALQNYHQDVSEAAVSEDFKPLLLPPPVLVGDARVQAMNTHSQLSSERKGNALYKVKVEQDELEASLYSQGLSSDYLNLPDDAFGSMASTLTRVNTDEFRRIAGSIGVKVDNVNPADIAQFTDHRGMLIPEQVVAALTPGGSTRRTQTPSGGQILTTTPLSTLQEVKSVSKSQSKARSEFVAKNAITQDTGAARTPEALRDLLTVAFPPSGEAPDGKPIYIGHIYEDSETGNRYIFRGGNSMDTSNWIQDK